MKTTKEIYLIGPGMDKSGFDTSLLKDKVTMSFSGDLQWFNDNKIHPTYWTFLDPNSTTYIFDRINEGKYDSEWFTELKVKSSLMYNDFQGTDEFYNSGFTTSRGIEWNRNVFGGQILPELGKLFKNTIPLPTIVLKNTYDSFYDSNLSRLSPIVIHERGINNDKLSCFILPMVLSYFTNLEKIHCIGFGDFTRPRLYTNSSAGYDGYIKSYERMKSKLIELLKHKNVNVTFENTTSYFNQLDWKPKEVDMEKITFCIPSKTNLRYLKTAIPSIRKNAHRKDHDIIVFVDSDEDGTIEWLESNAESYGVKYYVNPDLGNSLYGIGRAYDYCIEKATTDVVMIFHADMMLGKDADLNAFKYLSQGKVVCSTRVEPPLHPNAGEKIIEDFGMYPEDFKEDEFDSYVDTLLSENKGKVTEGIFAPWMVYKSDIESIGGHDPIMHSCREDSDLFNRFVLNGFKLIQSWDSLVYHLTGRGAGSFDGDSERHEQWKRDMNNSTKEFIRKWGSGVKHTKLMMPVIPHKYDIEFKVANCTPQILSVLEPWCSRMVLDCSEEIINEYIRIEQPNTQFDLTSKFNHTEESDVVVEFDARSLTQNSFNFVQSMSEIFDFNQFESGDYEFDIFKIKVNRVKHYENDLINL